MKSKFIFLAIYLLFLISCINIKDNNHGTSNTGIENSTLLTTNEDNSEFNNFKSLIPTIQLPFDFYCGINNFILVEDIDDKKYKKYLPIEDVYGIVGKFSNGNDMTSIIYVTAGDILYPYLYIFNNEGAILDSLNLHISYCYGDDSIILSNRTFINLDFSINMTDTTWHIHYDKKNKITDSIIITKRNLIFSPNGKYIIDNDRTIKL